MINYKEKSKSICTEKSIEAAINEMVHDLYGYDF